MRLALARCVLCGCGVWRCGFIHVRVNREEAVNTSAENRAFSFFLRPTSVGLLRWVRAAASRASTCAALPIYSSRYMNMLSSAREGIGESAIPAAHTTHTHTHTCTHTLACFSQCLIIPGPVLPAPPDAPFACFICTLASCRAQAVDATRRLHLDCELRGLAERPA